MNSKIVKLVFIVLVLLGLAGGVFLYQKLAKSRSEKLPTETVPETTVSETPQKDEVTLLLEELLGFLNLGKSAIRIKDSGLIWETGSEGPILPISAKGFTAQELKVTHSGITSFLESHGFSLERYEPNAQNETLGGTAYYKREKLVCVIINYFSGNDLLEDGTPVTHLGLNVACGMQE